MGQYPSYLVLIYFSRILLPLRFDIEMTKADNEVEANIVTQLLHMYYQNKTFLEPPGDTSIKIFKVARQVH